MASVDSFIRKSDGKKGWRVRWRTPDHKAHSKSFNRKRDADEYKARVETDLADNTYVDPKAGRKHIADLAPVYLAGRRSVLKPSSYRSVESAWRTHVEPRWGDRRLVSIRKSEVQVWVSELSSKKSSSTVLKALGVLDGIFQTAVNDRLVKDNPCKGLVLPKKEAKRHRYLTERQVIELADACGNYRALILTLGFCGLRWGEATALTPADLDFDAKRISVNKSATKNGTEIIVDGSPKNHEIRVVPMPDIVAGALEKQVEGKTPDQLVFTDDYDGGYVRQQSNGRRHVSWFSKALKKTGLPPMTCHDLRHTAASIAIHAGANVKAVQRMLGHKSAAMTLDTYADLFDTDLDLVTEKINSVVSGIDGVSLN